MNYQYRAYTADRQIVQGTIEAATEKLAEEALYQAGFQYILSLKARAQFPTIEKLLPTLFGVRPRDVIDFSRQIASFIESGISLLTALQLLEGQIERPAMRRIVTGLVKELQGGNSFSQALSRYPEAFSYSYCQVVRASEQAGELENGLKQVAEYMERQQMVASRIRRALTYPGFVSLMAVAVFVLMVTIVLPPMVQLFTALGVHLPLATRLMIAVMEFLDAYKLHLMVVVLAVVACLTVYARTPPGRVAFDRLALRMPLLGQILLQRVLGQFCRTAAMLLRAGLQLPQIMDIAVQAVGGNHIITRALVEVREKLVQGEGLSRPLAENPLFPPMMAKMIAIGEQTGSIDAAMATLADYYEDQANQRLQALIAMIEPTLTVLIGLAVAFILLAVIMPLYSVLGALR